MPDLEELFRETTNRVEAEFDALGRQHQRQRRHRRSQRAAVFAIAAGIAVVFVVGFWALSAREETPQPADEQTIVRPPDSGPQGLFPVDVATGTIGTRLIAHVSSVQPDISPDGDRLAFVRVVAGHEQIFVSTIEGDDITQVTGLKDQGPCDCGATDPDWSPDGSTIVFAGTTFEGGRDLFTVDVSSTDIRRLTAGPEFDTAPDWSHDGTKVVYTRAVIARESTSVWVLDLAGGRSHEVSNEVGGQQPVWSPDDDTIAFIGEYERGEGTDIWLVEPDGSNLRELVVVAWGPPISLAWSPDGAQIAFGAVGYSDGVVTSRIVLVSATTSPNTPEPTVVATGLTDPVWEPSGTTIIGRAI